MSSGYGIRCMMALSRVRSTAGSLVARGTALGILHRRVQLVLASQREVFDGARLVLGLDHVVENSLVRVAAEFLGPGLCSSLLLLGTGLRLAAAGDEH